MEDFIGEFLVLTGIVVTIIHFNKSQSNQLKALGKQIEAQSEENRKSHLNRFQSEFWKTQLDLYIRASTYSAKLTQYELDSEEYNNARREFYMLFWGPMSIVEDDTVKKSMEDFSTHLSLYEKSKSLDDRRALRQKSFQLARKCRKSSVERWELKDFELGETIDG